jgi:hypothetical protein
MGQILRGQRYDHARGPSCNTEPLKELAAQHGVNQKSEL